MKRDRRNHGMNHVDHRINEIEAEVVGLKVAVNAIDEKIDRQTQVITDLVRDEKANPGLQIAFATLFLGVVIFYNNITSKPISQTIEYNRVTAKERAELIEDKFMVSLESKDTEIATLWGELDKHVNKPGHREALMYAKDLEARILVLENLVQGSE